MRTAPCFSEHYRRLSEVPLYLNGENDDAELMSKKQIMASRMQGLHDHMVFRGQLLRAALLRAELRAL